MTSMKAPRKSKRRPGEGGASLLSAQTSYPELISELKHARSEYRLATSMAWAARRRRDAAMDALCEFSKVDE
jgi:hypothetical protein